VGRLQRFFNCRDIINVQPPEYRLEAWLGYQVEPKLTTQGHFMLIDSTTKFVDNNSILQNFQNHLRNGYTANEFFKLYDSGDQEI
jgi:hypothetical protein